MSLQPLSVSVGDLADNRPKSNLKLDYASGVTEITVYDIGQFKINQVLLIGDFNNGGSEIISTHASTAPTGFTVTLVSALAKPHAKDTPVKILDYDQVEFSHAATLDGVKTVLDTITIDPDYDEVTFEDSVNTAGYYFSRYKNSITSSYSDYMDGVPYDGLPDNTVGYAIDTAMNELRLKFSEILTFPMMIEFAKHMLRLVRGKMKAWSKYQEYGYTVDTITAGVNEYSIPNSIYDSNSNRSVVNLWIDDYDTLTYIDRTEYLERLGDGTDEDDEPLYYNISDGVIYLYPVPSTEFTGKKLLMDFYTDIEDIDSQMDVIRGTKFDMLIPYLKFKARAVTENNGKEDLGDPSYGEFRELLNDAIRNDGGTEINGFYPRKRSIRKTRDNDLSRL